jgi:hypothetical protein
MLMGEMVAVGDGGEGGKIPIRKGYLNIPTPTFRVILCGITNKGYIRPHIGSKVWGTKCKLINHNNFPLVREA